MIHSTRALFCVLLLGISHVCLAYTLHGSISEFALPLSSADLSGTTIRLLGKSPEFFHETYLQRNGKFVFSNVSLGSYLLSVDSITLWTDSKLRVVISPNQVIVNKIFAGHDWETDAGPQVDYPIEIDPVTRPLYLAEREKFNTLAMLKSPMVLLTIGSIFIVFVLPKMVEGLG